jgi:2-iminobutanoate/2-iminopropanoate deaminase
MATTRQNILIPAITEMYDRTLLSTTEYGFGKGVGFAHAVVTEGGRTLRMSGYPAISTGGIVGKGDMGVQVVQALEHVKTTLEAAGATFDDVVHMVFYFTDREQFWKKAIPARKAWFQKVSKTGQAPCVTSVGVTALMHPDMMIEVDATAVF